MNLHPQRRGAAAIIALIILSLTGLTVTTYTRADSAAIAADAAMIPGWRAHFAAHAGLGCLIAWDRSTLNPTVPPQISGAFDITFARLGIDGFRITANSWQSSRSIDTLIEEPGDRPAVTSWETVGTHKEKKAKTRKVPPGQAKDMDNDNNKDKTKQVGPPDSPGKSGEAHGKADQSNGQPGLNPDTPGDNGNKDKDKGKDK